MITSSNNPFIMVDTPKTCADNPFILVDVTPLKTAQETTPIETVGQETPTPTQGMDLADKMNFVFGLFKRLSQTEAYFGQRWAQGPLSSIVGGIGQLVFHIDAEAFKGNETWDLTCSRLQMAALALTVGEYALAILFPPCLAIQLAVKTVTLVSSILNNLNSISKAADKIYFAAKDPKMKTQQKVMKVAFELLIIGLAVSGLVSTFKSAANTYKGLQAYRALNAPNKELVMKHGLLETVGEVKAKNAIIIDGNMLNPHDPRLAIYNEYNTRYYAVKSSEELGRVFSEASKEMGGKLDHVFIFGKEYSSHGIKLTEDFALQGAPWELQGISNHLASNGRVSIYADMISKNTNSLIKKFQNFLGVSTVVLQQTPGV